MKFVKSAVLALALLLVAEAATAQATARPPTRRPGSPTPVVHRGFSDLRALGVGLVIIGAAMGIGGLTKSAVESMARQPEIAGQHPDGHDHLGRADRRCHVLRADHHRASSSRTDPAWRRAPAADAAIGGRRRP